MSHPDIPAEALGQGHDMSQTVKFLQQKLSETAVALDQARLALEVLTPISNSGPGNALHDQPSVPRQDVQRLIPPGASIESISDESLVTPVPAPSCFCMDILEMEGAVRRHLVEQISLSKEHQSTWVASMIAFESSTVPNRGRLDILTQRALVKLVFDRWKWTSVWYFETMGLWKLYPITRWRISPTTENYLAVQPQFRPTKLQLSKFHWPIIDWHPFPTVRDRMIEHAHEIDLSEVILTSMRHYCLEVEVDTNENTTEPAPANSGFQPETSTNHLAQGQWRYYRLQEYIAYVSERDRSAPPSPERPRKHMSKTLEAKFVLSLNSVETSYKLEASFFERFPMLYCEEAVARGTYTPIYEETDNLL